ncbi:FUSC family protein [Sphingomonas sp. dw_22]|uniref:FUSC family protein n=1 Tax=Sphingomonas sp. dw_22 TaxID=2721175 RepID=UPI001BD30009|nr:FUSC family protein [Sphingomonas sp. dw_22]
MKLQRLCGAHLHDTLRWSHEARFDGRTLAIAAIGAGVPILAGLAAGRPALGLTIGLGSMLLAGDMPGEAAPQPRPPLGTILLPVLLAVVLATALAPVPGHDVATIALAGFAATFTNYSRPAAIGAIRFIVYFVLNLSLMEGAGAHGGGAALLFGLGALWRAELRIAFRKRGHAPKEVMPAPGRTPTPAQRRIHWRRTLRTLQGWQYPLRLAAGLAAACLVRDLWPAHHFGWIILTVALLTPRQIEHLPVQITQRAIGNLIGVGAVGMILHANPPLAVLGLLAALLATVAPLARAGNYLLYSAVSTPVILLAMDIGKPLEPALLGDRLIATLGGSAIVVAANLAMDRWLCASAA